MLHHVKELYVFGSVINDRFKVESDIDLLVSFQDMDLSQYADNYFDLKQSLENIFHRQVDLLEQQALKNPYFKDHIDQYKQLLYGSGN